MKITKDEVRKRLSWAMFLFKNVGSGSDEDILDGLVHVCFRMLKEQRPGRPRKHEYADMQLNEVKSVKIDENVLSVASLRSTLSSIAKREDMQFKTSYDKANSILSIQRVR